MADIRKLDEQIIEGKTKIIYKSSEPGYAFCVSKERITAQDGAKSNQMVGKAAVSNKTTCLIFSYLKSVGIPCAFERQVDDVTFLARHCHMIPIEFVTRRVATGSFLKRNPGVPEGYRFEPVKVETFFKDDAKNDPQMSHEQLVCMNMKIGGTVLTDVSFTVLEKTTRAIFEILERAWGKQNCSLIDMKIEFGIDVANGEVLLADVIDSDSWRLWPNGDKRLMVDKQVYRDMEVVTDEGLRAVLKNFTWVAEQAEKIASSASSARVLIIMGSGSDMKYCEKIASECRALGISNVSLRICSAHKATEEALTIGAIASDPALGPCVVVAVAGRSNGLGPVLSGNLCVPVINAPPVSADWAWADVWSSLRMPSGLGCTTVISAEAAALAAAQIHAVSDCRLWAFLRALMLKNWVKLMREDEGHNK